MPQKYISNNTYTVVSAVYNVDRYIDEYFKSLVSQSLGFKKNIHLILVDDGSTDNTAKIIKRWQKKYPDNITYIWQVNKGQASARNLGMKYVKTSWVTFIDPDDFLDVNYFISIDMFLSNHLDKNIIMCAGSLILYNERGRKYLDNHPLKFKFEKTSVIPIYDLGRNFQLSASSAFFLVDKIRTSELIFDVQVKPNFEDGKFISEYLLSSSQESVGFVREAKYFYRKRSDESSTLDNSWLDEGKYSCVLKNGYLDVLKKASSVGEIPTFIQNTILYDLAWHIKKIVNHSERVSFLSQNQRDEYLNLLRVIFSYIDEKVVHEFSLAGIWFYHKVGILGAFKDMAPYSQITYIENFDLKRKLVELRYFSRSIELETIEIDRKDVLPIFAKTTHHDFLGKTFVLERRIWIPLPSNGKLVAYLNGKITRLTLAGHQYRNGIDCSKIHGEFAAQNKYSSTSEYKEAWLFMDRDVQADDNAEHLYRYVRDHHPIQEIYFALRRDSHDWDRLKKDGFNLVEFGSTNHENILRGCAKLISSHADRYVTNYLGPKMLQGRHFVFLQHGITKDDISSWLNQKEQIDCFVTATKPEYLSITNHGSRYKFGRKDVVLTGFPRHDALLSNHKATENIILIMPTWRQSIVGKPDGNGNKRLLNPDFLNTKFAKKWCAVLHSDELKYLSELYGYQVVFFPHANIQPYLSQMAVPEYISVVSHKGISIQDLFVKAKFMVTDYSSVAFEMAVQSKGVIYYQFDENEVFAGSHIYTKGYFDYRRDGFGPVVVNKPELFSALQEILENNGNISNEYKARIKSTFPFSDKNNCLRTYEAIVALDKPLPEDFVDKDILLTYAEQASKFGNWSLAESRWQRVNMLDDPSLLLTSHLRLGEALREQGKLSESAKLLAAVALPRILMNQYDLTRQSALLAMAREEWATAESLWERLPDPGLNDQLARLQALAELGECSKIETLLGKLPITENDAALRMGRAWLTWGRHAYEETAALLSNIPTGFSEIQLRLWQPQLLLSRIYRLLADFDAAHRQLVAFEQHTHNAPACRAEIARLAEARSDWGKVIRQLEQAYPLLTDMPFSLQELYLSALFYTQQEQRAIQQAPHFIDAGNDSPTILRILAESHLNMTNWASAEQYFRQMNHQCNPYSLAYTLRMQGRIKEAFDLLLQPSTKSPHSFEQLKLSAELAQLSGRWDLAASYWNRVFKLHAAKVNDAHISQWSTAILMAGGVNDNTI